MGQLQTARKIASATMVGAGSVSAVGAGLYGVMRIEALLARRAIGNASEEPPPNASGWYGRRRPGPAIKIALLGDSGAAGYGVERVEDTPGAHLASGVASHADRRVYLGSFPVVGARSSDLMAQVERALPIEPDVVVISIGGNDVTHGIRPARAVADLVECMQRITATGAHVVVGTCPDLGTVRPIAQPLRQYARAMSRRLATAQAVATVTSGGRSVSLGDVLGPEFAANPATLFGPDQFHPSAQGYSALAATLLPSTLAALGLIEGDELIPGRGEGLLNLVQAAGEAARTPGTELDGTAPPHRGVRGRLVELRHRRRQPTVEPETPTDSL